MILFFILEDSAIGSNTNVTIEVSQRSPAFLRPSPFSKKPFWLKSWEGELSDMITIVFDKHVIIFLANKKKSAIKS